MNVVFQMSTAADTQHQGLFIEEGSGGLVNDLVFYGGAQGLAVGNQQFTMRNLTFFGAQTAIQQLWDWGWTYKGISINNCGVGLDMSAANKGQLNVGGVVMLDSEINGTPVGIKYGNAAATGPPASNNIILENVRLNNVPVAVQGPSGATVLAGSAGPSIISAWGRGHQYTPTGPTNFQGPIAANARPAGLVTGTEFYERSKPQYENVPVSQFVSVRTAGAAGNGVTDDTAAINAVLATAAAANKIVFFDAGTYVVTGTIYVPAGSRIVGEAYPVILSSGAYFADMANPKPVVQIGKPGELGLVEWSDMIVSTRGAQAGATLIEWNLASAGTPSGMWDVHTRVGGFAGSDLQVGQCPKTPTTVVTSANLAENCIAAFMSMHITASASGLYMENVWLWVADHDVEDPALTQITIYAGRGLLIESTAGNIWLYGTAVEHHVLYEYQLAGTSAVVMGQIQTETAYYQPNPDATIPFPALAAYQDPVLVAGASGWGLRIVDSSAVLVYGVGLYSFFSNNNVTCSNQGNGEACQSRIFSVEDSSVSVYNLNTVGTTNMITLNGADVAVYSDNLDGFVDSIALFRV
jgi:glucan 1,3-beta-glucosidase